MPAEWTRNDCRLSALDSAGDDSCRPMHVYLPRTGSLRQTERMLKERRQHPLKAALSEEDEINVPITLSVFRDERFVTLVV